MDVLSEILLWNEFEAPGEAPGNGEMDSAMSRPPLENEGEPKGSKGVKAQLKNYDSTDERESQGTGLEKKDVGVEMTTDQRSHLTLMEVDQEIVTGMVIKNPLLDEHSLDSFGSARSCSSEVKAAKAEALGGSKLTAPELWGGADGRRASLERMRSNHSFLPKRPASSHRCSSGAHFRSNSFKERGQQQFKEKGPYNHVPAPLSLRSFKVPLTSAGGVSQRMRFTPQQQKELRSFRSKVKWIGSGIEAMDEAHVLCTDMGMDIKQLKKWISNHRPKRFRTLPNTKASGQPAWLGLHNPFSGICSEAALQSLNAAQPALVGNASLGPFHPPSSYSSPPWGPPFFGPAGMGLWPNGPPAALCPKPVVGACGAKAEPPQAHPDAAKMSVVEAVSDGSSKSSVLAGQGRVSLEMARLANADNLRRVLGRKLKDLDPTKVRKLVELCKKYRQEQSTNNVDELPSPGANNAPLLKEQAISLHDNSADPCPASLHLEFDMGANELEGAQWGIPNGLQEAPPQTQKHWRRTSQ
ncbi:hypothetical protein KFL_008480040 [Klebsormidium nitens]|uniref:Homeobox domain-containing protein n=1 Tax=Klebsormidium nitens TaxID=105231 RepID=A0A1Y1IMA1_KLENI|nr:hypothetical protein KFL_008480040 [Klebsormidium nitens]|eukprot:GAQ91763.1 hypothetical protein KFL_008480040 [Klebsormidium nitens]